MRKSLKYFNIFIIALLFWSCQVNQESHPVRIAISKAVPEEDYENYFRWLRSVDSTIELFDMYHLEPDSALTLLQTCDGLLFTGGTDIYPGRYGKESDTARILEPNLKRDTLEFELLSRALELKLPVQGICRGLQLINVYFGGSLIIDIPSDLDTIVRHQLPDTYQCSHEVEITAGSLLHQISGITNGNTNSNHHQGIELLGNSLKGMAATQDGLIEAIGFKDQAGSSYLFAVQWHPERLDYDNPLSGPVADRFIKEAKIFAKTK